MLWLWDVDMLERMSQSRHLDYIGLLITSCHSQGMSSVQGRDFLKQKLKFYSFLVTTLVYQLGRRDQGGQGGWGGWVLTGQNVIFDIIEPP